MPSSPFVDVLTLSRTFNAPRQRVFNAWKDPELLRMWLGGHQHQKLFAQVDFRVGGHYSLDLMAPTGNVSRLQGTYQEIEEPHRIVFTWYISTPPTPEDVTLVTVVFAEQGTRTHVTLTHERFRDVPTRQMHGQGWEMCFGRLHTLLSMS